MRPDSRILIGAALAVTLSCVPASAQENGDDPSGIIGPPQLREFELPGTTTTPAQPADPEAPSTSEPEPPAQQTPVAPSPNVAPAQPSAPATPRAQLDEPVVARDAVPSAATAESVAPNIAERARSANETVVLPTTPAPVTRDATAAPGADTPTGASASTGGLAWWQIALAFLVALAAAAAFRARNRKNAAAGEGRETTEARLADTAPEETRSEPVPAEHRTTSEPPKASQASAPSSGGVVGIQIRPWLNLEFRPAQAAATLTEAVVQFEVLITNSGNAVARNVRFEAGMFNAGVNQDNEISDFFSRPVDPQTRNRILAIPPRSGTRVRSRVSMPKELVREITVEGRRLFIPMVAINVVYEWGEGRTGQTSMSYLVGREPETPSSKMGAFRLDLGPRVYRSVGQRPSNVAVLV